MTRFARFLGTALLLGAALVLPALSADEPKEAAKPATPAVAQDVDITLCLDVSGSMQGLIGAAKSKLWDIVNELAKAKPSPKLRVALYSYGHTTYDPNK